MELFNYYSLDECVDIKKVKKTLTKLQKEGKIEYSIDSDILKIKDLDLDENELEDLVKLFDDYDIFANPDYAGEGIDEYDQDDNYDGYDDFDDRDDKY